MILALGGSWPQLGSDGAWVPVLPGAPLRLLHCGPRTVDLMWDGREHFRAKFAGQPVKTVGVVAKSPTGAVMRRVENS